MQPFCLAALAFVLAMASPAPTLSDGTGAADLRVVRVSATLASTGVAGMPRVPGLPKLPRVPKWP
jgi:hypothetical protein